MLNGKKTSIHTPFILTYNILFPAFLLLFISILSSCSLQNCCKNTLKEPPVVHIGDALICVILANQSSITS